MGVTPYREAEQRLWQHYGLSPSERFVELPAYGTRLRVQELGTGEPVLFLHGSPSAGANFAPLLPHLAGVRSIVVDRPGNGLSETPAWDGALLLRGLTALVADILDALELERAHVVGSSVGGTIALRGAFTTPQRIDRLVLLGAPAAIEGLPMPATERLLLFPGVARLASRFVPGRGGQRKAFEGIGHAAAVADGRIPDAYWDWNDRMVRDTGSWRDELASYGKLSSWSMSYGPVRITTDDLAAIDVPTLIVWGEGESYGGRGAADHLARAMPDAHVRFMAGVGHLPWLDEPEIVGADVAGFLGRDVQGLPRAA